MATSTRILSFGLLSLCTAALGTAQTFSDDFESYAAGSALEGQGGWAGWDNVNTTFTTVTTAQAHSGSQSIQVNPGADTVQEFTQATTGDWVFSLWVYAPASFTSEIDIMIMNAYAPGGPYEWGSWLTLAGGTSTVTCNCGGIGAGMTTLPVDRWFEVRKEIDLQSDMAEIWFDGTLLATYPWSGGYNGNQNHGLPAITAIDLYATGSGDGVFIDDVNLMEVVSNIGSSYCMAAPNSTGSVGAISALGATTAAANNLTLMASDLPTNQFGIFITSMTQAFVPGAGGTSNGNLCLGGSLGRFSLPNQILTSGSSGSFELTVDTTQIPQGSGFVTIMAGETWNYQAWHRDPVGVGSNFTGGLEVMFN